jgi:hypothetical protein
MSCYSKMTLAHGFSASRLRRKRTNATDGDFGSFFCTAALAHLCLLAKLYAAGDVA